MTTEAAVMSLQKQCSICSGMLETAIDLPHLPLTDTYCREPVAKMLPAPDQRLLYCADCGHGQLEVQIAPEILYGSNYFFRTSASATARKGTAFFLSVLDEAAPGKRFRCVLDLGCNDLFLLDQLKERADIRIGIDPVWKDRESDRDDPSVMVIGSNIEEVDLKNLPAKPDLVVCRHTLEHIFNPFAVLTSLQESVSPDALFLFEVPSFDSLVERGRFDQVFHQHLQYFSLCSFKRLIQRIGASYLLHRVNYHDWGAMAVAFTCANIAARPLTAEPRNLHDIQNRYQLFRDQMRSTRAILNGLIGTKTYGYGAAQMLPVLAYHLETDLSQLTAILDDDPNKNGIGYRNLPIRIMHSARAKDISESSVLITAIDNVQPIMTNLLATRPRHILYPLHII